MKANLPASFSSICQSFFSNKKFLTGRNVFIGLLAAFSLVGITSSINAEGGIFNTWKLEITSDSTATSYDLQETPAAQPENLSKKSAIKIAGDNNNYNTNSVSDTAAPSTGKTAVTPSVKVVANYCVVPSKVRLTATSIPAGATFSWSTGETGAVIDVDIANMYDVVATFSNGTTATASKKVAEELVVNGDFSDGNTGFFSEYGYTDDVAGNSELVPEGMYGVGTSGQDYHAQFFGREHSTPGQTGNFMIINGSTTPIGSPARQRIIWQETVKVKKNTSYYLSAQAMNINPASPAELQFQVNGVLVGTIADLDQAAKPYSDAMVNRSNWVRFYTNPTWNSGNDTTADIRIINLNTEASGNDFGLDDISFSTLSPFITLTSGDGTDAQTTCLNTAITPIVYSVGSDSSGHSITGLPPGITATFTPNVLTFEGAPTAAGLYTYSITTTGTCKPVTVTGTINIPSTWNTWTGAVSNDWSNANNWGCGTVPVATTNVLISNRTKRMPQLTTVSMCNMLNLQTYTSLDLNGQSFTNYGGISGTGIFKGSALSNLTIDAAGTSSSVKFDQSVPGAANALNNFTIKGANDSVNVNAKIAVYGVLAPQNGLLTMNDTLILRSTALGTASVDVVGGKLAYNGVGKVAVERYFPARRSWRLVTSPLAKSGTIFDNWQNGGRYEAGKGTYVSGVGATSPVCSNGLDWSPMNNASLKAGLPFAAVLNTKASLSKNMADSSDNIPYFMFVRGDRDPVNTNVLLSNNTTLSSAGKLQTGTQSFTAASTAGGFAFVGNPYASPVDFSKLVLNNLKKHFWVWDPYLNTEQGGYVLVEEITDGVYDMIPHSPAGLNKILQSSQAFFVETIANGPASITFQESAKSCTTANLTAFRPIGSTPIFRSNLYHKNDDNTTLLLDGIMAIFDSAFSKDVDERDVIKQSNSREMISLVRNTKTLTVERRPSPKSNDTLFLRLNKTTQRNYRLEFEPTAIDPMLTAFLEDAYTNVKTPLDIANNSLYDFEINGDAASADANRFKIVFRQATKVLPVTYRNIHAKQQAKAIAVDWTVENEINIKSYEVERSSNGVDFKKVNTTAAVSANSTTDYKWLDESPLAGNNYYRVRSISADGKSDYSKIAVVNISTVKSAIAISPNPASGNVIGVAFKNMVAGTYQARLLDGLGQTVLTTKISVEAGSTFTNLYPESKLMPGVYQLMVTRPDRSVAAVKVVVE